MNLIQDRLKMKPLPPNHKIVTTEDGSETLFSERFQESCHSTSGARAETILHYIEGCEVQRKLNDKNSITILEVGFGLGMGFLTTLETLQDHFHFISLEIDRDLVEWFRKENTNHDFLKHLTWISPIKLEAKTQNMSLTILVGDARETLDFYSNYAKPKWDAIYQDAFSPKKNPTLWTQEWFELLKKYSAPDALMSTYSSGDAIRKAMLAAGWVLNKGPGFGKKRSSTRASLVGKSNEGILDQLKNSSIPALRDDNIKVFLGNS
jgi:tRNA U34 5-methylaminomethyl-2-thiouridine-forming methyltransferase MnmC